MLNNTLSFLQPQVQAVFANPVFYDPTLPVTIVATLPSAASGITPVATSVVATYTEGASTATTTTFYAILQPSLFCRAGCSA